MDGPNPVVRKGAPPYDPQKFTGYWDNVSRTQSFPNSPNKSPGATKRVLKPPTFGTSNGEYDLIPPITGPPPARNSGLPHPPAYAIEPADLIGKSPALPQRFLGAKDPTRIPSQQPQQHHQNGGGGDIYCPAGSQSSRNSSGIQVTTPSPSDSGHAGDIEVKNIKTKMTSRFSYIN